MATPPDLIIRPIMQQDAEALWKIARQEGVIETAYHYDYFHKAEGGATDDHFTIRINQ